MSDHTRLLKRICTYVWVLTYYLECVFMVSKVLALCDTEIVVRVLFLGHLVRRICCSNSQHGCAAFRTLRAPDLTNFR